MYSYIDSHAAAIFMFVATCFDLYLMYILLCVQDDLLWVELVILLCIINYVSLFVLACPQYKPSMQASKAYALTPVVGDGGGLGYKFWTCKKNQMIKLNQLWPVTSMILATEYTIFML